jgi:hypothetical protein
MRKRTLILAALAVVALAMPRTAPAGVIYVEEGDPTATDQWTGNGTKEIEIDSANTDGNFFDYSDFRGGNFIRGEESVDIITDTISLTGYTDVDVSVELAFQDYESGQNQTLSIIDVDTGTAVTLDSYSDSAVAYSGTEYQGTEAPLNITDEGTDLSYALEDYFTVLPSEIQVQFIQDGRKWSNMAALGYIEVIPEPTTMSLLTLGGLIALVRRRR